MMSFIFSKIKLFPVLILVAALALGLRVTEIVTGFGLLSAPLAAEGAAEAAAEGEGKSQQTGASAGKANAEDETAQDSSESKKASDAKVEAKSSPASLLPSLGLPSNEELELISQLRGRREQLDRREEQLNLKERLLAGTETRIEEKIGALQMLEEKIKGHLRIFEEQEAKQLESIVQVYQAMKPKDAAPRFQALELPVQVDLAMRMTNRKFADILAEMDQQKATQLTVELATRSDPPAIEDILSDQGSE